MIPSGGGGSDGGGANDVVLRLVSVLRPSFLAAIFVKLDALPNGRGVRKTPVE